MRPLVLLWGCLVLPGCGALMGPKRVRAFEGDTVSVLCTYGEKLRNRQKYWCRKAGFLIDRCSDTIYTTADGQKSTDGRVSIQDSPKELRFNVTLRALTLEDAGEYWCGVQMLGPDDVLLVSLVVLPGPCCSPYPTPFIQPLATSLQPKAKAWQTQPPALRTSGPSTHLDSASAKDASWLPSSRRPKSRACPTTVRMLAPVLVLLALLLFLGLCALVRSTLRWRKKDSRESMCRLCRSSSDYRGEGGTEDLNLDMMDIVASGSPEVLGFSCGLASAQLDAETQRNEKAHHSHLDQVPEYAMIRVVEATPEPAASPCTEIQCPGQTSEQEEAPFQDPNGDVLPGPPLHMSEELRRSVFVSV